MTNQNENTRTARMTGEIPANTTALTLTGEEAQALEEVCSYETDTIRESDCWESEEEAKAANATADLLATICQRLNTTAGMMTAGGTLAITLAEAMAIAEAVGDAGWVMGDTKADDAGSDEEAERSHAVASTAYSVRNNQLAEAITQLVAASVRVPEYETEGEEPPEWVWDTVFSSVCEMCGISTEADNCWLWDTLSGAVTSLVSEG